MEQLGPHIVHMGRSLVWVAHILHFLQIYASYLSDEENSNSFITLDAPCAVRQYLSMYPIRWPPPYFLPLTGWVVSRLDNP